jgi:hypothetical protein
VALWLGGLKGSHTWASASLSLFPAQPASNKDVTVIVKSRLMLVPPIPRPASQKLDGSVIGSNNITDLSLVALAISRG